MHLSSVIADFCLSDLALFVRNTTNFSWYSLISTYGWCPRHPLLEIQQTLVCGRLVSTYDRGRKPLFSIASEADG